MSPQHKTEAIGYRATWLRALLLTAALLGIVIPGGCGLRTNPSPLSSVIPVNQEVVAWFRENTLVISWRAPEPRLIQRWGNVASVSFYQRVHPLGCPSCPPFSTAQVTLKADAEGLTREGLRMYYEIVPQGPPGLWEIQVKTRYRSGENSPTAPVIVNGLTQAPKPELKAEVLAGGGQVRLYWPTYRERIVHRITGAGGQEDSALYFRANVYRRTPPAAFPMTPINLVPVDDLQLVVPLRAAANEPIEFTLRLVDQFGNEGPQSPPVRLGTKVGA